MGGGDRNSYFSHLKICSDFEDSDTFYRIKPIVQKMTQKKSSCIFFEPLHALIFPKISSNPAHIKYPSCL